MFVKGHFLQENAEPGIPILGNSRVTRFSPQDIHKMVVFIGRALQGENRQDTCTLMLHRAVEVLGEGHSLTEGLRSPNPGAVTWVTPDCA